MKFSKFSIRFAWFTMQPTMLNGRLRPQTPYCGRPDVGYAEAPEAYEFPRWPGVRCTTTGWRLQPSTGAAVTASWVR
jgi:hypothetical protein